MIINENSLSLLETTGKNLGSKATGKLPEIIEERTGLCSSAASKASRAYAMIKPVTKTITEPFSEKYNALARDLDPTIIKKFSENGILEELCKREDLTIDDCKEIIGFCPDEYIETIQKNNVLDTILNLLNAKDDDTKGMKFIKLLYSLPCERLAELQKYNVPNTLLKARDGKLSLGAITEIMKNFRLDCVDSVMKYNILDKLLTARDGNLEVSHISNIINSIQSENVDYIEKTNLLNNLLINKKYSCRNISEIIHSIDSVNSKFLDEKFINRVWNYEKLSEDSKLDVIKSICSKQKYNDMTKLLKLHSDGKISDYIFGDLSRTGEIRPIVVSDADKLLRGESVVPRFSSDVSADKILKSTKIGDAVSVNGTIYFNEGKKLSKSSLTEETFAKLFPLLESHALRQGGIPNCYFISGGLTDFMGNPETRIKLYNMIKQDGNDIVVTIPLYDKFPTRYKNGEIKLCGAKYTSGAPGLQMIEQAYARARYQVEKLGKEISFDDPTDISKAMEHISYGHSSRVYNEMLGTHESNMFLKYNNPENKKNLIQKRQEYADNMLAKNLKKVCITNRFNNILDKYSNKKNLLMSACTRSIDKHREKTASIADALGILTNHAYSIEKIDPDEKAVWIINPYNTIESVKLSYDQFNDWFSRIYTTKLNNI